MTSPTIALLLSLAASSQYGYVSYTTNINKDELEEQKTAYKQLWDKDLIVRLEELPKEGKVPEFRIPYSGHDYPDKVGGTLAAMAKYDRAFNRGISKAYQYEREDLAFHTTVRKPGQEIVRRGMFGRVIMVDFAPSVVPTWYGHCNGWTAASIRHAEPQKSVVRNGVVITPADIKGMLAELYMYSQTQFLGGTDDVINPAIFHISLTNWLGRNSHPIGMETAVGEPVINFPIHAYKSTITKVSGRRYDVRTLITYTVHIAREVDKGPKAHRQLYFHYLLDVDGNGNIAGGQFYGDSARIDMLWTPLQPVQGGQDGNRGGNPHLDLEEVMAIYRESVEEETLKKWVNVDPDDWEVKLVENPLPSRSRSDREDKPKEMDPAAVPAATDSAANATETPIDATVAVPAAGPEDPPPAPSATPAE